MFTKNWNRIRQGIFALTLALALAFGGLAGVKAQDGGPLDLFGDVAESDLPADLGGPVGDYVARSRFVTANLAMLFDASGKPRSKTSLPQISLNLFPNARFTGIVTSVSRDRWGSYWYGRLKGQPGYFHIVVVDDTLIAHVASPVKGVYEVSWAGSGLYKSIQIDQSKFVDHDPSWTYDVSADELLADELSDEVVTADVLDANADSASRIDIMVAYTDDARAAEGSTAAMKARIALAVAETNQSYANSGVNPRLRLVHVEEYSYAETGNLNTDLTRFRGTGDAYFTSIHNLRNVYAADMVGLIVENGGAYCGLASAIMATASNAFQVTARSCATGYYSFGHEFGHLQGARHDTYMDPTNTPYAYGHGYVHPQTTDPAKRWRTIMAYNNRCSSWGYSCTRIQYWSNPTKTYTSDPMGVVGSSENYKVLNNTASTVANFRTQIISSDFNSSFNGSSAGWSAVKGSWGIASSAYYRSAGLANTGASAKRTGKYGDVTYEVRMKRTGTCTTCANRIIIRGNPASLFSTNWWKPSYVFQYTNDGSFSVFEATSAGTTVTLKGWTTSAAIVKNGWNTLKVVAVGKSLKFYINGTLVWSGNDTTLKVGQVGVGFYRNAATGVLYVDWAKARTTATADLNPFEVVAPGVETGGGSIDQSR